MFKFTALSRRIWQGVYSGSAPESVFIEVFVVSYRALLSSYAFLHQGNCGVGELISRNAASVNLRGRKKKSL